MVVKSKENNKLYEVNFIQNDKKGYPHFLIFNYYGHDEWTWISAKNFVKLDVGEEAKKNAEYYYNKFKEFYNGL